MFVRLQSQKFGTIIVNQNKIMYISSAVDGSTIAHFDDGGVLSISQSFNEVSALLYKPDIQYPDKISAIPAPQLITEGKKYPDEFPDDWPRYKNGKICTTSKKYIEFMKGKEV